MTDISKLYPELATMNFMELVARRKLLTGDRTTFAELPDADINELAEIANLLRKKQAGPPKEKAAKKTAKTATASVEDFNL